LQVQPYIPLGGGRRAPLADRAGALFKPLLCSFEKIEN